MYRNVYFPGVQRSPANHQQNGYMQNPIPHREYPQFNEFSPQANSAIMAYAAPILQKPYEKMSLNEALKTLRRQGKIEGRDYETNYTSWLDIKNKRGYVTFNLIYDNCYDNHPATQRLFYDQNDRLVKRVHKNNGTIDKVSSIDNIYYNNEISQETFTQEGITYRTKPEDYIEYLKSNNINYKVSYENDDINNKIIRCIEEFDNENRLTQDTIWHIDDNYNGYITRNIYNDNEESVMHYIFDKECTEVSRLFEKSKYSELSNRVIPQESLTKEHITAYTKPDEYIQYLEDHNIRYKIKPQQYGDGRKTILIKEYDNYGQETQLTGFELNGENRVFHEVFYPDNSRKRYEFDEENTYITTFTY